MEHHINPKPSRAPRCGSGQGTEKEAGGLGGISVSPCSMKPAVKVPCVECPLRRTAAQGYLGGYTPEMYLEALHSPASIACHMSPGFQERDISRQHHCTGVAGYRANVGHIASVDGIPSNAHLSTRLVGSDPDLYFASPEEFYHHHKGAQVAAAKKGA